MTLLKKNMFINHMFHISSFHTLPNIPLKTKLKMKNLVHLFLAILYYLMVFSFIIVILSIGYQFLKWIWE